MLVCYLPSICIVTGEPIRFRVSAENFVETSPSGPEQPETAGTSDAVKLEQKIPYTLTVSYS